MPGELFQRIVDDVEMNDRYFKISYNGRRKRSFAALHKCTSVIRQLAYGTVPDACDVYLQMSSRVSRESLERFVKTFFDLYHHGYLHRPTTSDVQKLYTTHESKHRFPIMLESIDCTHWAWRNCPTKWWVQYTRGDHQYPTIMLEEATSHDLWIWHSSLVMRVRITTSMFSINRHYFTTCLMELHSIYSFT
jgi:hypothetical protein